MTLKAIAMPLADGNVYDCRFVPAPASAREGP